MKGCWSEEKFVDQKDEICFVLPTKYCTVCVVSIKSIREKIPGNENGSQQNASNSIQNSFFLWCFKGWILVAYAISKGTLLCSILLEQKIHQLKAKVQRNHGCKAARRSGSKKIQINGRKQVGWPSWKIIW